MAPQRKPIIDPKEEATRLVTKLPDVFIEARQAPNLSKHMTQKALPKCKKAPCKMVIKDNQEIVAENS